MNAALIKAIVILPGTALVFVPVLIVWTAAGTSWAVRPSNPWEFPFWIGLGSAALGLVLAVSTMRDFKRLGQGTPAPWASPKNLVVSGPYCYVRNPMISGVLFMLGAESLLLGSWALALWLAAFFTANAFFTCPWWRKRALRSASGSPTGCTRPTSPAVNPEAPPLAPARGVIRPFRDDGFRCWGPVSQ